MCLDSLLTGRIEMIAKKHNLKLIEDSCEALGAEYKRKNAGSLATRPSSASTQQTDDTGEGCHRY